MSNAVVKPIAISKPNAFSKPVGITALFLASLAAPILQAQSDSELPAGPMQAKATTACAECHEARIIVQQRLSKAAWTKEVDKMTKWGALVDPQDRDALIDYLSTNFGVDKPPYLAGRTQVSAAKKQKK
jgi:mono/diheme cytochrome c family protein